MSEREMAAQNGTQAPHLPCAFDLARRLRKHCYAKRRAIAIAEGRMLPMGIVLTHAMVAARGSSETT